MGPFATRPAAENRVAELRRQGAEGPVDRRRAPRASSRSLRQLLARRPAAVAYAEELARVGDQRSRRSSARSQPVSQTLVVVRDPQQSVVARLRELCAAVSGQRPAHGSVRARDLTPFAIRQAGSVRRHRARARPVPRNTPTGSPSTCASRVSPTSSRRFPASTRRRAAACSSRASAPSAASRCGRSDEAGIGEVKRLYVRDRGARNGLGARSSQTVLAHARAIGYRELRLDTAGWMRDALRLYARLGFREWPPYYHNPHARCGVHEPRALKPSIVVAMHLTAADCAGHRAARARARARHRRRGRDDRRRQVRRLSRDRVESLRARSVARRTGRGRRRPRAARLGDERGGR